MSNVIRHPEWRASLEPTKYPFSDTATLTNTEGLEIPSTTFIDASFYVAGGDAGLYLTQVSITADEVTIYVGVTANKLLASVTFDRANPPAVLAFKDVNDRAAGMIISEAARLAIFSSWGTGDHVFTQAQTAFVARCCHAVPTAGLRGFELDDGSVVAEDVWLVGDDGVVLSCADGTDFLGCVGDLAVKEIRIDIVGDTLFRRKLCSDPLAFETPRFLESLTFVAPGFTASSSSYYSNSYPSVSSVSSSVAPQLVDVLFYVDVTNSMSTWMPFLRIRLPEIRAAILADMPSADITFGIIDYSDVGYGGDYANTAIGYGVRQTLTADATTFETAAAGLATLSGSNPDTPEGQFMGFMNIGGDWLTAVSGRTDATKIIIQIGDAPGFLKTGTGITAPQSDPYPLDLATVATAMNTDNVKLIMISFDTTSTTNEPGLDEWGQSTDFLVELDGAVTNETSTYFPFVVDGTTWAESTVNGFAGFYHQILMITDDTKMELLKTAIVAKTKLLSNYVEGGGSPPPPPPDPVPKKKFVVYPGEETSYVKCGPGTLGDVKIFVHSNSSPETILRVRAVPEGLKIEAVGERLENIG